VQNIVPGEQSVRTERSVLCGKSPTSTSRLVKIRNGFHVGRSILNPNFRICFQVCYCQPGYTGDPYFGCDVLDLCEASPCGPGARCDNSRGSYKCLCPLGTVGDPYKDGCRSPVECQIDEDCPPAAHCVQTNGIPKCQDNCEKVKCGPNAECGTSTHYGSCVCHSGYQGDPNDLSVGCRPRAVACTSNQQCPSNTYCYDGACKRKSTVVVLRSTNARNIQLYYIYI